MVRPTTSTNFNSALSYIIGVWMHSNGVDSRGVYFEASSLVFGLGGAQRSTGLKMPPF